MGLGDFASEFARQQGHIAGQRAVAAILAARLQLFMPQNLEAALKDGWSVVKSLAKLSANEACAFFLAIPAVKYAAGFALAPGGRDIANQIVDSMVLGEIVAETAKTLPDHAAVPSHHPEWIQAEISRVKERWLTIA